MNNKTIGFVLVGFALFNMMNKTNNTTTLPQTPKPTSGKKTDWEYYINLLLENYDVGVSVLKKITDLFSKTDQTFKDVEILELDKIIAEIENGQYV